MIYRRFSEA